MRSGRILNRDEKKLKIFIKPIDTVGEWWYGICNPGNRRRGSGHRGLGDAGSRKERRDVQNRRNQEEHDVLSNAVLPGKFYGRCVRLLSERPRKEVM